MNIKQFLSLIILTAISQFSLNANDALNKQLHQAVGYQANLEKTQELLDKGANVNAINPASGNTPLHTAIYYGSWYRWEDPYEKIVKLLLERGADTSIQNKRGDTPIRLAEISGNPSVINLVKETLEN